MNILAIDPGPISSAYTLLIDGKIADVNNECPNEDVRSLIAISRFSIVAIEKVVSYGMSVGAEVFETVFWSGRFAEAAKSNSSVVLRIPRINIKKHLCNDGHAKDGNIRQALIDRLGKPGTKKHPEGTYGIAGDGWAALAVGIIVQDFLQDKTPMEIVP